MLVLKTQKNPCQKYGNCLPATIETIFLKKRSIYTYKQTRRRRICSMLKLLSVLHYLLCRMYGTSLEFEATQPAVHPTTIFLFCFNFLPAHCRPAGTSSCVREREKEEKSVYCKKNGGGGPLSPSLPISLSTLPFLVSSWNSNLQTKQNT